MEKSTINHVLNRTTEKIKTPARWKLDKSVFVKYIAIWGTSFAVFFMGTFVATIVKNNSFDNLFYKTIANNSILALFLSSLFSSFAEFLWEDAYEKSLDVPKKIVTAFSFVIVIILFLINNTFDILSVVQSNSVFFEIQYDLNLAFGITVFLLSIIHFALLSLRKTH